MWLWWVLANIVVGAVGLASGGTLGLAVGGTVYGPGAVGGAVGEAEYGVMTRLALVWLLEQPVPAPSTGG